MFRIFVIGSLTAFVGWCIANADFSLPAATCAPIKTPEIERLAKDLNLPASTFTTCGIGQ